MEDFIKCVLDRLGFGIGGVMTKNPKMFAGRINDYFPYVKIEVEEVLDGECTFLVVGSTSSFKIKYLYADDGRITYVMLNK